jgi:hypothetical protein
MAAGGGVVYAASAEDAPAAGSTGSTGSTSTGAVAAGPASRWATEWAV